ncbi:hypothetical protein [Gulosibacter bifidus]|uniref:Uncharacterized protein n=1 Tax=Gulosibacter bifidus TaxID=272239 RepID=A0ABW5RFG6_9MICO|nr:hypothetical protein [Gulosibacter bifidus]
MCSEIERLYQNFSSSELWAMYLAGEVGRIGVPTFEFFVPVGTVSTACDRARSLRSLCSPGRTISGDTAAWIWAGGTAPSVAEVTLRSWRVSPNPHIRFARGQVADHDVTTLAGCVLTAPLPTLRQLQRRGRSPMLARLQRTLGLLHAERVVDAVDAPHRDEHAVEVRRIAHLE